MSEETASPIPPAGPIPSSGAVGAQAQAMNVQIRDDHMNTVYSNIVRLSGTHEELFVDFAVNMQHHDQPNTAIMDVNTRVIMSFYAAKRLALHLSQAVQRYEQMFGPIQLDPRQRQTR
jgi:hypothetical protein